MKRPIENNSSPGQAVYEPFSGSGTTIIAAEISGRSCHAIELAPQYVDVAVERWQAFTGKAARLEVKWQSIQEDRCRSRRGQAHMTRPAHKPDDAQRRQVEAMSAYGIPENDISRVLRVDPKPLRKHYRDELDLGSTKANAQVAGLLFNAARNGNVTAQIFWLKTRARWKEAPSEHQHTGALGTFDVRELSDQALERIVFGTAPNLPPMSQSERRKALAPVLQAVVSASTEKSEPSAG
jgi:hypothetical protein